MSAAGMEGMESMESMTMGGMSAAVGQLAPRSCSWACGP
jgi:hypothetical protein